MYTLVAFINKLLVRLIQLLFHPKNESGAHQNIRLLQLFLPSGALVYKEKHRSYNGHVGNFSTHQCSKCTRQYLGAAMFFVKSLREHASAAIDGNLYINENTNTSTKPQGTCECCNKLETMGSGRPTPVYRTYGT